MSCRRPWGWYVRYRYTIHPGRPERCIQLEHRCRSWSTDSMQAMILCISSRCFIAPHTQHNYQSEFGGVLVPQCWMGHAALNPEKPATKHSSTRCNGTAAPSFLPPENLPCLSMRLLRTAPSLVHVHKGGTCAIIATCKQLSVHIYSEAESLTAPQLYQMLLPCLPVSAFSEDACGWPSAEAPHAHTHALCALSWILLAHCAACHCLHDAFSANACTCPGPRPDWAEQPCFSAGCTRLWVQQG